MISIFKCKYVMTPGFELLSTSKECVAQYSILIADQVGHVFDLCDAVEAHRCIDIVAEFTDELVSS